MSALSNWAELAPSHWTRAKLKHIVSLRSGNAITSDSIGESGEYPVYGGNGLRGYTSEFTHDGQFVLIGRQGALCGNINYASGRFWASEHAIVASRKVNIDTIWLGEMLRFLDLNQLSQSAAQPGISAEEVANLRVAIPPYPEQSRIAGLLQAETTHIDKLIAAKQRLLDLLEEKRKAIIASAVTRGLNPDAPMRDSGVPWIGEIPRHWAITRLKFCLFGIEQGWSPQCETIPAGPDDWGVLKTGCVNGDEFDPSGNKRLPDYEEPRPDIEISEGDVLMSRANTTELVGSIAIVRKVKAKLMLCDKLYRLKIDDNTLNREYAVLFLRTSSGRFEFERSASGASNSMQNISQELVKNLWIPIPTMAEQKEIVEFIATKTQRIDELSKRTKASIALLEERRSALISSAVTGKLEVTVGCS